MQELPNTLIDPLNREEGEPLDFTRHTKEELKVRQRGNPRVYAALWQQTPRPEQGLSINANWFTLIYPNDLPDPQFTKTICRAWDLAYSVKQTNKKNPDYSVGVRMSLWLKSKSEYYYVIHDIVRFQKLWPDTKKEIFRIADKDGLRCRIVVEIGGPQAVSYESLYEARGLFKVDKSAPPSKDKLVRAQDWIDEAERGRILLLAGPHVQAFLDECNSFPNGIKDDQVDAVSIAYWYLSKKLGRHGITITKMKGLYS